MTSGVAVAGAAVESVAEILAPIGPKGLPYKTCVAMLRNAEQTKRRLEGSSDLT